MSTRRLALPTGELTFLFTDIEGATRLLHTLGDAYVRHLEAHGDVIQAAVERHDGVVVKTEGGRLVLLRASSFASSPTPNSGSSTPRICFEALRDEHHRESFASSQEPLDRWLIDHALSSQARRTARTFVWHLGDRRVIAYYSLTAHLLQREQLPRAIGRGG